MRTSWTRCGLTPAAHVPLIGPSPFDDITRPPRFSGGYAAVIHNFSDLDRDMALARGLGFVDFNAPVAAAIVRAQTTDPAVARLYRTFLQGERTW